MRRTSTLEAEDALSLLELRRANLLRNEQSFGGIAAWSPMEWACAMAGEAGETCNAAKKLQRMSSGTNTAKDPQTYEEHIAAIAAEIADTIIYADLLAARLGIDLSEAVRQKFNAVSARMRSDIML